MNINKLYSKILRNRFIWVLKNKGWNKFREKEIDSDNGIIQFGLYTDEIQLNCFFQVSLERAFCVLYLIREGNISKEYRNKTAEYLSYANQGLVLGNFEIDMSDGEVRYKTSLPAGKLLGFLFYATPSKKELLRVVDASVSTAVRYCKGIDLLQNDSKMIPKEAYMQVNGWTSISETDTEDFMAHYETLSEETKKKIKAIIKEADAKKKAAEAKKEEKAE